MATPVWFDYNYYMAQKVAQVQKTNPAYTLAQLEQTLTAAGMAGADGAYKHFQLYGEKEDVSPNKLFNAYEYYESKAAEFYKVSPGAVTAAQTEAIKKLILGAGSDAWDHYTRFGAREGSNPSNSFDTTDYLTAKLAAMIIAEPAANWTMDKLQDTLTKAGVSALEHFAMFGGKGAGEVAANYATAPNAFPVAPGGAVPPEPTPGPTPGSNFYLTVAQDNLIGTAGDDTFYGYIFDNQNTFQSGDQINGGLGTDTIMADIGNSQSFAITVATTGVEVAKFRAQSTDSGNVSGNNNVPTKAQQVDAERMVGLKEVWSDNSRADLVVEDVRLDGVTTKVTKDLTFGFSNTDPGGVDFKVYLDPQALRAEAPNTAGAVMTFQVLDQKNAKNGHDLQDNPYDGIKFMMDGKEVSLKFALVTGVDATYDMLADAINAALKAAGLNTLTASKGALFSIKNSDGDTVDGYNIVLTNSGPEVLKTLSSGLTWQSSQGVPSSSDLFTNVTEGDPTTTCNLITTNVVLDNVGRVKWDSCDPNRWYSGSEAGEMIVGSMATRGGVESFEVTVEQGSWLKSLSSTNNSLQVVTVENGVVKDGSLFLGSTDAVHTSAGVVTNNNLISWQNAPKHMQANGLKDVRIFDAITFGGEFPSVSGLTDNAYGQIKLGAQLTIDAFDKYMDKVYDVNSGGFMATQDKDNNPDPSLDDLDVAYNLGKGDDALNLQVNKYLTADNDFTLIVNGNDGDDIIDLTLMDTDSHFDADGGWLLGAAADNGNWLINQQELNNITVNGGDGNDTITTHGAGNVKIEGGAGNDTVYADNSGLKAVFVLNAQNLAINPNATQVYFSPTLGVLPLANNIAAPNNVPFAFSTGIVGAATTGSLAIDVSFLGVSGVEVLIPLAFDASGICTTVITPQIINQFIKAAVNNDPQLSKILVAKDGAGFSLLFESLVDGQTDLVKDFSLSYDVTYVGANGQSVSIPAANGLDILNNGYGYTPGNAADNNNVQYGMNGLNIFDGSDSLAHSDNIINLGIGNDVAVLGTGANSNDTIVLEAGFGSDTIVNFTADNATTGVPTPGIDKIDLSAFGITTGLKVNHDNFTTIDNNTVNILNGKANSVTELTELLKNTTFANNGKVVFMIHDGLSDEYQVFSGTTDATGNLTAVHQGTLELAGVFENTGLVGDPHLTEENFNSNLPAPIPPTPSDYTPVNLPIGGDLDALNGKFLYSVASPTGPTDTATVSNFSVNAAGDYVATEADALKLGLTADQLLNVTVDVGTIDGTVTLAYSPAVGQAMLITLTDLDQSIETLIGTNIASFNAAFGYDAII